MRFLFYNVGQISKTQLIAPWTVPFIQKNSFTDIHYHSFYIKEGLSFLRIWLIPSNLWGYLFMFLASFTPFNFLILFSPLITVLLYVLNWHYFMQHVVDEDFSNNFSGNIFVFGGFNIHHEEWLNYCDGTDKTVECCYNFSFSNNHTHLIWT